MASIASVSRHSIVIRIGSKIKTVKTWLIRSVTSVTICANSCVSDVMRLTILPVWNSS